MKHGGPGKTKERGSPLQTAKWQVSKETCLGAATRKLHLCIKVYMYRVLEWVQSYIPSRWSPQHLPLSRLHPWNSFSGRKDRKELYHAVQLKENCIGEITLKKKKSHNNQWYN